MSNLSPDQFRDPFPHIPHEADCDGCGGVHTAEYSHEGQWGQGPIYAVPCDKDGLTSYHNTEGVRLKKKH